MFLEVASLVIDAIWVFKSSKEADLFENVLPFLQRLLAPVGHLLDGHHLACDVVAGVVNRAEAAMADLTKVIEELVGIFALE